MEKQPQHQEQIPRLLLIHLNTYGQLEVKTRLVLTAAEVADLLTLSAQKVRWMMYRGELPSFHIGSRRLMSLDSLKQYLYEREREEQEDRLYALKRYYGYFGWGEPYPEIQRDQERLDIMQRRQGDHPVQQRQGKTPVAIEAALYHIAITEAGRLECTPRWLLSMQETAQLLGISRATLWQLSKQEDFPVFHINRRTFVRVESLLAWIQAKEHPKLLASTTTPSKRKQSPKTKSKKQRSV